MAVFTDSTGEIWQVQFTIATARRLRDSHVVDINDPKALADAIDDLYKRFDLLWACCAAQAESRNINPSEFDLRISPTFADANIALNEALADFFRLSGQTRMVALLDRVKSMTLAVDQAAVEKVNSEEVTQALNQVIARARDDVDRELARLTPVTGGNGSSPPLPS